MVRRNASRCHERQQGFTYLALLVAIALLNVGLLAASEVWVTTARRQKAAQLIWVGEQFVQAIGSYYESTPGGNNAYPAALKDLLEDPRYPSKRRHLREIYPNPLTGKPDWELVLTPFGTIRGIQVKVEEGGQVLSRTFVYPRETLLPPPR